MTEEDLRFDLPRDIRLPTLHEVLSCQYCGDAEYLGVEHENWLPARRRPLSRRDRLVTVYIGWLLLTMLVRRAKARRRGRR